MTTEYTWAVTEMTCYSSYDGESNVVFQVTWKCTGVSDVGGEPVVESLSSSTNISLTQGQPFIPYDQLTEEQVLQWVWDTGPSQAETEASIQTAIDQKANPPVANPSLPWATPAA
jgi:hypothetical protein